MQPDLDQALSSSIEKVNGWVEALIQNLPNVVAAVLVLIVFVLLARVVRAIARSLMDRATDHGPVKSLVGTIAYVAVLAAGVVIALGILDLDQAVTSVLAGVGIVGLALGFAFQDIAANFISGVLMSVRRPFTDGDLIETGDYLGVVDTVDLRSTTLRLPEGPLVRIPNADVYGNPIVNYSQTGARRVDVSCGVSYADDLERAAEVALEAGRRVEGRDESRDPELFWEEFGGSSINFVLRFWIPFASSNADYLRARSRAMVLLKKAFDDEDVGIPYPITTLDFGDVGGRRLSEELEILDGGRS